MTKYRNIETIASMTQEETLEFKIEQNGKLCLKTKLN
jgi:hypothetical protein